MHLEFKKIEEELPSYYEKVLVKDKDNGFHTAELTDEKKWVINQIWVGSKDGENALPVQFIVTNPSEWAYLK